MLVIDKKKQLVTIVTERKLEELEKNTIFLILAGLNTLL